MKFSIVALVTAAVGAYAHPARMVQERDVDAISTALVPVAGHLWNMQMMVKNYTGNLTPIQAAFEQTTPLIKVSEGKIAAQPVLDMMDTMTLQLPCQNLSTSYTVVLDILKSKRDTIAKNNQCGNVRTILNNLMAATQPLINTILGRTGDDSTNRSIANGFTIGISSTIQGIQNEFVPKKCANANGSS